MGWGHSSVDKARLEDPSSGPQDPNKMLGSCGSSLGNSELQSAEMGSPEQGS